MASATTAAGPVRVFPRHVRARAPRVDFLGIGAQKAGTTWLHRMLRAHPEIYIAEAQDKDLRFFSAYYDYGYGWYESHFGAHDGAKVRGEFSTSYLYCKDSPERVHRYNPAMRLIVSLREPVQRLISHHKHEIRLGRVADLSLERAIENNPSYIEQSMYFTQLSRWLEYFPLSRFHVVILEELALDPARAIRDLYEFLGASTSFVPVDLHEKVNEGRIPRSRFAEEGVRLATFTLRTVGAGRMVDSLKRAGIGRLVKSSNSRSDGGFEIDDVLIERLRSGFAEENAKLAALLGRNLSMWAAPNAKAGAK